MKQEDKSLSVTRQAVKANPILHSGGKVKVGPCPLMLVVKLPVINSECKDSFKASTLVILEKSRLKLKERLEGNFDTIYVSH